MAKILVVEDSDFLLKGMGILLKRNGHEVVLATDGFEALRCASQQFFKPFDLVITDVFMPKMNGDDLASRFRESYPRIKLIVISGGGSSSQGEVLEHVAEFGAATLKKPFKPAALLTKVQEVLAA